MVLEVLGPNSKYRGNNGQSKCNERHHSQLNSPQWQCHDLSINYYEIFLFVEKGFGGKEMHPEEGALK